MRRTLHIPIALLCLAGLLSAGVSSKKNHVPEIGEKLKQNDIPASASKNSCASSPSQTYPCFEPEIDGIKYTVGFQESTLRVMYIHTSDRKFKTADGFKVGDVIDVKDSDLMPYDGWYIFAPRMRDGWRPIVGMNMGCTDDGAERFDVCGNLFRKSHPGKARISGFSKGGLS